MTILTLTTLTTFYTAEPTLLCTKVCAVPVCTTQHVLSRITKNELVELVNDPLPKALNILDFNNEMEQRVSDEKARQYLTELLCGASASALQHFGKEERNAVISQMKAFGASIRQISRLTGVSEGIVRNIKITQSGRFRCVYYPCIIAGNEKIALMVGQLDLFS